MDGTMLGVIGLVILVIALLSRMPAGFAMAVVGLVGYGYVVSWDAALHVAVKDVYGTISSYNLTVIPMFLLMGELCFSGGISKRLFDTAQKVLGHMPGGLAMATIGACSAFAAVCGSTSATAATMGSVAIPEMKRYKYKEIIATGSVAAGGTMGLLIPPSVIFIVYGIATEQSIGKLFAAGIIPGILLAALMALTIYVWAVLRPDVAPRGAKTTFREKLVSLSNIGETLLLFALVMGGLFLGFFTPVEAGGVGAGGALLVGLARRKIKWEGIVRAAKRTTYISCMVFFLLVGGSILGRFLAVTEIAFGIAEWIGNLPLPPWAIMGGIIFIYLIGGCFIDALALILLTIPIFCPIVTNMGYDPIWFGVIIVLICQLGAITPPVGLNCFVVSGIVKEVPIEVIFKGSIPFLVPIILACVTLLLFPQLALVLPNALY